MVVGHFTMANLDVVIMYSKVKPKTFSQVNGAVLASSTANGNSDVAAVVMFKVWQPFAQVITNIGVHVFNFVLFSEEVNHSPIEAC